MSKTVLLTGATGLIGRALTRRLLTTGHTVIATSRRAAALDALGQEMMNPNGKLVPLEVDLLSVDANALAAELAAKGLAPHHLINNARDIGNLRLTDGRAQRAQWLKEFDINVVVPAELTLALASLSASPLEAVVNIGSMYGITAVNPRLYDNPAHQPPMHYGVAKAALLHLTKELAVRLAPKVRVNAVSFGGIEGRTDEAFKARYRGLSPNGRMLRLDETHAAIEFLLSDGASAMTGHNLVVDGGWTLW